MPKYVVTGPDGKEYEVDAPEGASEQQIIEYVRANYAGAAAPAPAAAAPKEEPSMADQLRRQAGLATRGIITGLSAPVNVVADFASGAYNLGANLLGSSSRLPYLSQAQQRGLTAGGLPMPETGVERAAQAGMQGLTGTAGAARAAPQLLGANLAQQLPAAAAAPAAAEAVASKTKEVTGSDLAALVAGIGVSGAVGQSAGNIAGRIAMGRQPAPPTMDSVRQTAQRRYQEVSDLGIKLNNTSANDLVTKIKTRLDSADYLPENATEVANVLKKYDSIVSRGDVSFNDVDQMRRLANNLLSSQSKDTRRLGREMVGGIDEYVANLSAKNVTSGASGIDDAVKKIVEARKDWRNLSRATTLDDILNVSEARALRPTASESELIRTGFINLAANKEKMRLFDQNERNAIRAVANGGSLDNFLTLVARFNPQRSQLMAGGAGAAAIASPETLKYTVPTAVAGFGADKLQALMRQRAADRAIGGLLSGQTPPPLPSMYSRGLAATLLTQPPQE
jgi:hypothetical protein